MFIRELVEKNRCCFHESCSDWRESIKMSCQPLIDDGSVTEQYITAMIKSVEEFGPYIVLAPDIAMPHSQQGADGVNSTAISFMKVEKPVSFEEGNPEKDARLFFVLASKNNDEHMANMVKLTEMLVIEGFTEKMLAATCKEDLLRIDEELSGS